jgi:hypothetical protein
VWITTEWEGFHRWKDAPEAYRYLANVHRHLFKIRVEVDEVADHGIEFHYLKHLTHDLLKQFPQGVDFSCEDLATFLGEGLSHLGIIAVSVSEDGECGCIVTIPFTPKENQNE